MGVTKVARRAAFGKAGGQLGQPFPPGFTGHYGTEASRRQSWSCRLSDSISSASAVSLPTSVSILRTACSTVV